MVLQTMLEVALNSVRPFVDVLPLSTRGSWLSLRGRDLQDLHEREETLQHRRQKHVVVPTRVHRLLHQLTACTVADTEVLFTAPTLGKASSKIKLTL